MTPSTTMGSKVYIPGPVWYVHAISSCLTFDLLICLRDEYCEESAPPRYWLQVAKDRSAADSGVPHTQRIGSMKLSADLRIMGYPPTAKFTTSEWTPVVKLTRALWQREGINCVAAGGSSQFGNFLRQLGHFQIVARHHTDVLFAFRRVSDRTHRDVAADDGFPKLLPIAGVESAEPAAHVAMKDQTARGGKHGAIPGSTPHVEAQYFAGSQIDLRQTGQRVGVRTRAWDD